MWSKTVTKSYPHPVSGLSTLTLIYLVLLAVLSLATGWIYFNYSYRGMDIEAQDFDYPQFVVSGPMCVSKSGRRADHQHRRSAGNIPYSVTTPANYRRDYPHPLLVVWAPSGFNASLSERFTGLTGRATARGYIVVHVASVPLGFKALRLLAAIPDEVVEAWCVDPEQIYYTGHSDGGTVSNALAVLPERRVEPAAIAPSAMGMKGGDMKDYACPGPTNVMLMHNLEDGHFPDYGGGVAQWWATCNRCGETPEVSNHPGCVEFPDCANQVRTLFCQARGNHAYWPGFDHDMMAFFEPRRLQGSKTGAPDTTRDQELE